MKRRYFISASLPEVVAGDRLFARYLDVLVDLARRLQALVDLSESFAHVARPLVWI
jgi:hypothetical protein